LKKANIASLKDLENLLEIVLSGEKFEIVKVKPISHELYFYNAFKSFRC